MIHDGQTENLIIAVAIRQNFLLMYIEADGKLNSVEWAIYFGSTRSSIIKFWGNQCGMLRARRRHP